MIKSEVNTKTERKSKSYVNYIRPGGREVFLLIKLQHFFHDVAFVHRWYFNVRSFVSGKRPLKLLFCD